MKVKGVPFTTKFYVDKTPSPDFGYINLDSNCQCNNKEDVIRKRDVLSALQREKGRQQAEKDPDQFINLNFRGV